MARRVYGAAIAAVGVKDTVKQTGDRQSRMDRGLIRATIPRDSVVSRADAAGLSARHPGARALT
jgi:hypothetical protein